MGQKPFCWAPSICSVNDSTWESQLIRGQATSELRGLACSSSLPSHPCSQQRTGLVLLFAALNSGTIISSPYPLLSSDPELSPVGSKPTAKPSPVKGGQKLVTESSPMKTGEKRKAPDETPCQTKVRARMAGTRGCFGPGPHVPNPPHMNFEMKKGVFGTNGQIPSPPAAAPPSRAGPAVPLLHPVPSCCLAEAASQRAERKESCASRQAIEQPSLAKRGCRDPPSCWSQVTNYIKGEKAQSGCGSAAV